MTGITQVFNNTSSLQAAGGADSEDSFRVTRSTFALRAEGALAPQHGSPHYPLGQIVGWLYEYETFAGTKSRDVGGDQATLFL